MSDSASVTVPRAGMLATVRNRSGVVAAVEPFDGDTGRLHLVHMEYKDSRSPGEERVLWELEPGRSLLEPTALPDPTSADAMPPEDFDALLRAARWTALSPYLGPDGEGPPRHEPLASPFHGAVRPEDYQLVPLLKALRMPRVSLLIADDVGLGKTIEAGLILTELLLRRRIRLVLVLARAALRWQWRDELWEKFSLRFEVVDRHQTAHILNDIDLGTDALRIINHHLDVRGFWRDDRDRDPELRHTVLTLIAFDELRSWIRAADGHRENGIEAFLAQNDGDGWLLPETLCLADYGLGHDDRAKHPQPVASRVGPRFYDWQLVQDTDESSRECHLHARHNLGEHGYLSFMVDVERQRAAHDARVDLPNHQIARGLLGHESYGRLLDRLYINNLLHAVEYYRQRGCWPSAHHRQARERVAEYPSDYSASARVADDQGKLFA